MNDDDSIPGTDEELVNLVREAVKVLSPAQQAKMEARMHHNQEELLRLVGLIPTDRADMSTSRPPSGGLYPRANLFWLAAEVEVDEVFSGILK